MPESGVRLAVSLLCLLWLCAAARGQTTVRVTDHGAVADDPLHRRDPAGD